MIVDPDQTLQEILELTEQITEPPPGRTIDNLAELGGELAEKVKSIDEWMMRGGYAPARWNTRT